MSAQLSSFMDYFDLFGLAEISWGYRSEFQANFRDFALSCAIPTLPYTGEYDDLIPPWGGGNFLPKAG